MKLTKEDIAQIEENKGYFMNEEFLKLAMKLSIVNYEMIDLDPSTQTSFSVIIKGDVAVVSSLGQGLLAVMSTTDLLNKVCAPFLLNVTTCDGYIESSFLNDRKYDFKEIIEAPSDSFGSYLYEETVRFCNLCKAVATEAHRNSSKSFLINTLLSEGYLEVFDEEKAKDIESSLSYYKEELESYDLNKTFDKMMSELEDLQYNLAIQNAKKRG